jgi:hypothetical protein
MFGSTVRAGVKRSTSPGIRLDNCTALARFAMFNRLVRFSMLAFAGLCVMTAASASAQLDRRAVVMPVQNKSTQISESTVEEIEESTAEYLRGTLGLEVTPALLAQESASGSMRECWTRACAVAYKTTFHADVAVSIRIAESVVDGLPISISFVAGENEVYTVESIIGWDVDNVEAIAKLLKEAWRKRLQGPGPWLAVQGSPEGAQVDLDGRTMGRLPFRGKLSAGDHYLRVSQDGYEPYTAVVSVPSDPSEEETVRLTLPALTAPVATLPATGSRRRQRRTVWDWVAGGVAAAVGAELVGVAGYAAARKGDCSERSGDGACTARYSVSPSTIANFAVGGALIVAGGVTIAFSPIGAYLARDEKGTTALLTYRGRL